MSEKTNVSVCRGHELVNALYICDRYKVKPHVYVFLLSVENACFNYSEYVIEGDLVGVP